MPKTHLITPQAEARPALPSSDASTVALAILFSLSFCHLLNDAIQALIPAIYPLLKESFKLSFTQIGLITLTFQMVGSVLQPIVGLYTDKHPKPFSLVFGMGLPAGQVSCASHVRQDAPDDWASRAPRVISRLVILGATKRAQ